MIYIYIYIFIYVTSASQGMKEWTLIVVPEEYPITNLFISHCRFHSFIPCWPEVSHCRHALLKLMDSIRNPNYLRTYVYGLGSRAPKVAPRTYRMPTIMEPGIMGLSRYKGYR